ncbi:GGDEF domain-containing protein [Arsukibacterium ikkense]|uniref:GGDEF domain-containing protein n=1 Tax=Arsukibacterium ikkense TaxID=336831 RepID=UPI00069AE848|nr:GGDEF domain-containing protein [Arsukibacterium ikkense]
MNEPQHPNIELLRNSVLKLHVDAQSAELVRMRCEFLLQHNIWYQQQQQMLQSNQLLSMALLQASTLHSHTQLRLQQVMLNSQCDTLTQTLNRSTMLDRIGHAISVAKRQHSQFGLLFIDLDNFKPVNDRYGHAAGDAVLQQMSARLMAAVRGSDAVSRHGGDEFLLLLTDLKHREDISAFTTKIQYTLAQPCQFNEHSVTLSASIGVAIFPLDGDTPAALINYADAAMYLAKKTRNTTC